MIARKKNLLDAFKASATAGPASAGRNKNVQAASGGPFAPNAPQSVTSTPASEAGSMKPLFAAERRPSTLRRMLGDRTIQLALVGFVVIVAGVYWLGRQSGVAAAAEEAPPAASGPGVLLRPGSDDASPFPKDGDRAKANQTAAQIGTNHDQAFIDKQNQFTVRIVQYKNDEVGKSAARATYEYLRREGYPVISPIVLGNALIVCVGYEPKAADLGQLIDFVKALRGPNPQAKKPPFESSYVVNIDDVVQR